MWERISLSLTIFNKDQIHGSEVAGEVLHPSKLAPWLVARAPSIHTLFVCVLNDTAALHMMEGCDLSAVLKPPQCQSCNLQFCLYTLCRPFNTPS